LKINLVDLKHGVVSAPPRCRSDRRILPSDHHDSGSGCPSYQSRYARAMARSSSKSLGTRGQRHRHQRWCGCETPERQHLSPPTSVGFISTNRTASATNATSLPPPDISNLDVAPPLAQRGSATTATSGATPHLAQPMADLRQSYE
jgi:hypothetical protein